MRLLDLVTPELLEKTLHTPHQGDPVEDARVAEAIRVDCIARMKAVKPLADVLKRCLQECGSLIPAPIDQQNHIQQLCLSVIDAAIEAATKETV